LQPEELAALVHREISALLYMKKEPVFSNVTIWPRALPQYNLGHGDRLSAIAKACSQFPGLSLTGNYLRGPAIGSCVDQALGVAENVRWVGLFVLAAGEGVDEAFDGSWVAPFHGGIGHAGERHVEIE